MKIKTNIKAGGQKGNHNQTQASSGLKLKTNIKAGINLWVPNHNQTHCGAARPWGSLSS